MKSNVTVICHRGWWKTPAEQNTLAAFARAFDAGLGVELDVRDWNGALVVSHDPPMHFLDELGRLRPPAVFFDGVLDLLGDRDLPLAVNVKSCGLAPLFAKFKAPKNWFFFDAAPGDEESYSKNGLPLFARENWDYSNPVLTISPEIFGMSNRDHWQEIGNLNRSVFLVTDLPADAMSFFGVRGDK